MVNYNPFPYYVKILGECLNRLVGLAQWRFVEKDLSPWSKEKISGKETTLVELMYLLSGWGGETVRSLIRDAHDIQTVLLEIAEEGHIDELPILEPVFTLPTISGDYDFNRRCYEIGNLLSEIAGGYYNHFLIKKYLAHHPEDMNLTGCEIPKLEGPGLYKQSECKIARRLAAISLSLKSRYFMLLPHLGLIVSNATAREEKINFDFAKVSLTRRPLD